MKAAGPLEPEVILSCSWKNRSSIRRCKSWVSSRLGVIAALVNLRSGACHPGTQTDEVKVTVPVGSATSKIPERVHYAWSESTVGLQQFYLRRGGIVTVELLERGAYIRYGTRPVSSRRNLRGGQKSSISSGLRTRYRRIKCAHQGGGGGKRPFKTGANEVAGVGTVLVGAGAGRALETTESAGGGSVDTGARVRVG